MSVAIRFEHVWKRYMDHSFLGGGFKNYVLNALRNRPARQNRAVLEDISFEIKQGSTVVDSSKVGHVVTVRGPMPSGAVRTFTNTDPGSSSFRYDAASKTWQFNLQTKDATGLAYPVGAYDVTIVPTVSSYQSSPVFRVNLVK